jgi:hypothetical protein
MTGADIPVRDRAPRLHAARAIVLTALFTVLGFSRLVAETKDLPNKPSAPQGMVGSAADS